MSFSRDGGIPNRWPSGSADANTGVTMLLPFAVSICPVPAAHGHLACGMALKRLEVRLQVCSVHWPMADGGSRQTRSKRNALASFGRYSTTFWLAPARQRYISTFSACSVELESSIWTRQLQTSDPELPSTINRRPKAMDGIAQFASRPR